MAAGRQDGLIGYTGFVGGNLLRQHQFDSLYNSANVQDVRGQSFRTLVHAGTQSKKWWANENPAEDWKSIEAALDPLREVQAEQLILISTIDVLPPVAGANEDFDGTSLQEQPYGGNRARLEREIRNLFPSVNVIRLPGLFGQGLKKNVIYDLMNDNMLDKINPESRFQFYNLERLWDDITKSVAARLELVHLVPEPVSSGEIVERFFSGKNVGANPMPAAFYDFRTKHSSLFGGAGGYICDRETTLTELSHFVRAAATARGSS